MAEVEPAALNNNIATARIKRILFFSLRSLFRKHFHAMNINIRVAHHECCIWVYSKRNIILYKFRIILAIQQILKKNGRIEYPAT